MGKMLLSGKIWMLLFLAISMMVACEEDEEEEKLTMQSFMNQAAASDTFEITTGTMAMQKGTLTEVKDFGQKIVNDHTMSSRALKSLAAQKNIAINKTIPADKAAKIAALNALSGTSFDKTFASQQVEAHQEAIALYEKADRDITDTQVQAFVDAALPVLRNHLQQAQQLKDLTD